MKWKHLFQYHILDRGLDYYNSGHVSIEEISETQILATVAGSEYYEVCINLKNGEIASMHCDCPYADGGSHCKHMAAVLYATAQEYEAISTSPQPKKALAEAIAALPREMLEQLLLEQGKKNAKLSEHIILIATKKLPKNYQSVWHAEISAILESDYSDYMDFDEAYDRFCDLSAYLDEKAEGLRKSGLLWEAFELVDIVYRTITDMEEFDWDTIFDEMMGTCNAWWSKLYDEANIDLRRKMFRWFRQNNGDSESFCESFLADTLIEIFEEPEFALELLIDVDTALQTDPENNTDSLIGQRITLMEHLGLSGTERLEFLQGYSNRPYARQLQVDLLISEGQESEAISLLKESKSMDATQPHLLSGYCRKLILLYQRSKQTRELREELTHYVLHYTQRDLEYIKLLKDVTPTEEWSGLSSQLQLSNSTQSIWDQLLVFDGQWEILMRKIEFSVNTQLLYKYEEALGERFPGRVRDLWLTAAEQFILRANDRGAYRYAAGLLQNAMAYPGGKEKAFTVASTWKTTYPRRTALREELKNVGL